MKKSFIFYLAVIVTGTSSFAQSSLFQSEKAFETLEEACRLSNQTELISLPQTKTISDWVNNSWDEQFRTLYSYYPDGRVERIIDLMMPQEDTSGRATNTYNGQYQLIESLYEMYLNENWTPGIKTTFSYDSHGNLLEESRYVWTGSAWSQILGNRIEITYNTNNYVTEKLRMQYISGNWENTSKEIYTLGASGHPTKIVFQSWNGQWNDAYRLQNISWFVYNPLTGKGAMKYYLREEWLGTYWNPVLRETAEYGPYGGYESIQEVYSAGNWANYKRFTVEKSGYYILENKEEAWQSGAWVQNSGTKHLPTFDGIDLVSETIQTWSLSNSIYENDLRNVYADFLQITNSYNHQVTKEKMIVFPNPASTEIGLLNVPEEASEIQLISLNGAISAKYEIGLGGNSIRIPVGSIQPGVYFIIVSNQEVLFSEKIIIQ